VAAKRRSTTRVTFAFAVELLEQHELEQIVENNIVSFVNALTNFSVDSSREVIIVASNGLRGTCRTGQRKVCTVLPH